MTTHNVKMIHWSRHTPLNDGHPNSTAQWTIDNIHDARATVRRLVGQVNKNDGDRYEIYLNGELQWTQNKKGGVEPPKSTLLSEQNQNPDHRVSVRILNG